MLCCVSVIWELQGSFILDIKNAVFNDEQEKESYYSCEG